jgi:hypothetical protein
MADRKQDLLGRLADLSEEAVQRLSEAPGADRVLQALKGLGDRVDELQRRTRGFEELERRLSTLEKRVDGLAKPSRAPKSAAPPKKP